MITTYAIISPTVDSPAAVANESRPAVALVATNKFAVKRAALRVIPTTAAYAAIFVLRPKIAHIAEVINGMAKVYRIYI
jgi:hypothetical protein